MATRATRLVTDDEILNAIGVSQGFSGGAKTQFRQTVLYRYTAGTFTFCIANWGHLSRDQNTREITRGYKDLTELSAKGVTSQMVFLRPPTNLDIPRSAAETLRR